MLRVNEICKEKGISQKDLAKKLGVTYQSLYANLNGNPTLSKLNDIASALGVEVGELFTPADNHTFRCPVCGAEISVIQHKEE